MSILFALDNVLLTTYFSVICSLGKALNVLALGNKL